MIGKIFKFNEKLEKEIGDLVRCSTSLIIFSWKTFLTHAKELDSMGKDKKL